MLIEPYAGWIIGALIAAGLLLVDPRVKTGRYLLASLPILLAIYIAMNHTK